MKKSKLTLDKLNVVRLNNTFQVFGGEDGFDAITNPFNEQAGSSQPCLDARAEHDARMNREYRDAPSSNPCKGIRRTAPSTRACARRG